MGMSYVCRSCRHQLLRRGAVFLERRPRSVARSSTWIGRPPRPSNPQWTTPETPEDNSRPQKDEEDFFVRSPEERQLLEQIRKPSSRGGDKRLEELFSASLSRPPTGQVPASEDPERPNVSSEHNTEVAREAAAIIAELQHMLIPSGSAEAAPASEIWQVFRTKILPHKDDQRWKAAMRINGHRSAPNPIFSKFIRHMVASWCHDRASDIPSPSQLRSHLLSLHLLMPSFWERIAWPMVMSLYEARNSPQHAPPSTRAEAEIVDELVQFWRDLFRHFASTNQTEVVRSGWPSIPGPAAMKSAVMWERTTVYHRFFQVLGKYPAPPMAKASSLPTAALASLVVLASRLDLDSLESAKVEHFPFLMMIADMSFTARRGVKYDVLRNIVEFSASPNAASNLTELLDRLAFVTGRVRALTASLQPKPDKNGGESTNSSVSDLMKSLWVKRIGRAEEAKDGARLHRLWRAALSEFKSQEADSLLQMPEALFELFMRAAFNLRQFDLVHEIFKSMMATYPNTKRIMTWNTALQTLQQKRDIQGIEQVWRAMIWNDVKPNSISWAIRIHGVISARRKAEGLQLLEEMDRAWLEAASQMKSNGSRKADASLTSAESLRLRTQAADIPRAQVDTNVINVALSALIRTRRIPRQRHALPPPPQDDQTIHRVLEWAAARGIQPDVTTYNLFLGDALRYDNGAEVSNILRTMEERGVQPDSYTLSHLLNARFRSASAQAESDEQMVASVTNLLDRFQQLGLRLNAHHYSILVDGLLRRHNNPDAARAVLAYMKAHGMQPTPYIYTMLATFYFNQDPPAVDAVAALCQDMRRMDDMLNVSSHFFGRVIEGYARLGDVGNMMAMFNQMAKDNRAPTWLLLQIIIRKMVEIDERATAESIFEDVRARRGPMRLGIQGTRQQRIKFWQLMSDLGFEFNDTHEQQYENLTTGEPSSSGVDEQHLGERMPSAPMFLDDLSEQLERFSAIEKGRPDDSSSTLSA